MAPLATMLLPQARQLLLLLLLAASSSALYQGADVTSAGTPDKDGRLGGTVADTTTAAFPEVVEIFVNGLHKCQGQIIAANMTITAASCLWDIATDTTASPSQITVLEGLVDKTNPDALVPVTVSSVFYYPLFRYYPRKRIFDNDLALIVPTKPFVSAPIKMPSKDSKATTGDIASWGQIDDGSGAAAAGTDILQTASLAMVTDKDCAKEYKAYVDPLPMYELPKSSLCTAKGLCKDDGGAGLVAKDPKTSVRFLVGIASQTSSTDCPGKYSSIFTKTTSKDFFAWLKANNGPKAQDK